MDPPVLASKRRSQLLRYPALRLSGDCPGIEKRSSPLRDDFKVLSRNAAQARRIFPLEVFGMLIGFHARGEELQIMLFRNRLSYGRKLLNVVAALA
jgi:hypothetical protein